MLWKNRRSSTNVTDRRGLGRGMGIGGVLIGAVLVYVMGGDPLSYLAQNSSSIQRQEKTGTPDQKEFASVVLADTEDVWNRTFSESLQSQYQEPELVLFSHVVRTNCGQASSYVGPFYCPLDKKVYLDLSFFDDLSNKLGASGDFAAAYVIAHEVGHHVQNLLGLLDGTGGNKASVRTELQADCLAGFWARKNEELKTVLEDGDIEEAMDAASAVGDDRLQERSQGRVTPDSFTHGSSAQRVRAFRSGFQDGLESCLAQE